MSYNPYGIQGIPSYMQSGTTDFIQGVPWVSSVDEVRSASVFYGRQMFIDKNNNVFYIKDTMGQIKAFAFEEVPVPGQAVIDPSKYVTKEEFDELRSQYEQLIQQQSAPVTIQSDANNAADATIPGDSGTSQAGIFQPGFTNGNGSTASQQLVGEYPTAS